MVCAKRSNTLVTPARVTRGRVTSSRVSSRRKAFTLAELAVSMAIMSILFVAVASAMIIATRALPDGDRPSYRLMQDSVVVQQIVEELNEARQVTQRSATEITFTVADRDGDGADEVIAYRWSGTAGDPVYRQYGSDTAVPIVAGAQAFALEYELSSVVETYPGPLVESDPFELASYTAERDEQSYPITANDSLGQFVDPTLIEGAVRWRPTGLRFVASRDDSGTKSMMVQVHEASDDDLPSGNVIAQTQVWESAFYYYWARWHWVDFVDGKSLPAGSEACLFFDQVESSGDSGRIQFDNEGVAGMFSKSGSNWSVRMNDTVLHTLYGTAFTPGAEQSITRQHLTGVAITLQSTDDERTRIDAGARLLNEPELLTSQWSYADGDDPAVDRNGDGTADWVIDKSLVQLELELGSGLVTGRGDTVQLGSPFITQTSRLVSTPSHAFTEPVTVDLTFQHTKPTASAAMFEIDADTSESASSMIAAALQRQPDATQVLVVYRSRTGGAMHELVTMSGLSEDPVRLRLIIDPAVNTVNVAVNGADQGTYAYESVSGTVSSPTIRLSTYDTSAVFENVSVRVGGSGG